MSTTRTAAALAALAATGALSGAAAAGAASPTRFVSFGNVRAAGAEFAGTSGCVDTHVEVLGTQPLASTTVDNDGVAHQLDVNAFMEVAQYDHCASVQLLDAITPCCGGPTPPGVTFTVARDLTSARLDGPIPLVDLVSNTPVTMAVHLGWTGIPPLTRGNFDFHINDPGLPHLSVTDHGSGEGATASGTVSDGTTNYTPSPTSDPYAFIGEDVGTFVHIGFTP
jgi:hypothetical protein